MSLPKRSRDDASAYSTQRFLPGVSYRHRFQTPHTANGIEGRAMVEPTLDCPLAYRLGQRFELRMSYSIK